LACKNQKWDIAELLLLKGSDPDIKDMSGKTARNFIIEYNKHDMLTRVQQALQGQDEAAEKQRIKEEKEKEDDDPADRDRQLRLATNEEAKVSNVVDSSFKLTHYVLPIA